MLLDSSRLYASAKRKNCPTCFRLEASPSVGEDGNSSDALALNAGFSSSDSLSAGVSNVEMDSMQIGNHTYRTFGTNNNVLIDL